jgi:acetolactate synthase-1/2/3 large subunit
MEWLRPHLKPDQVIVTDMGAALLSSHQALMLKPPQRLITSYGLGEMGCGLPFAVGASFARYNGQLLCDEVLCLTTDGGMMFNIQELSTIARHQLPVKIIVFDNDGYGMIKQTQKVAYEGRMVGVDYASGVSFPYSFERVASDFGIRWVDRTRAPTQTKDAIQRFMGYSGGPALLVVRMSEEQPYLPKLVPARQADGSLTSSPLEDLTPTLSRKQLKEEMG